jgi:hypothetical protein
MLMISMLSAHMTPAHIVPAHMPKSVIAQIWLYMWGIRGRMESG